MNKRILKTIGLWRGADGKEAEVDIDLGGADWYRPNWNYVDLLLEPRERYQTAIVLEGGERILLPIRETLRILPDRSGVFVVFEEEKTPRPSEYIWFSSPNNAAVFDVDGSLRFQLKNPVGSDGSFRAVVSLSMADGTRGLGVRVCPKDWPVCEDVYVVDGSTDDLSSQIPRWVRD